MYASEKTYAGERKETQDLSLERAFRRSSLLSAGTVGCADIYAYNTKNKIDNEC